MRVQLVRSLGGVPAPLVPALRSALEQQGFPGAVLTDAGDLDPQELLFSLVDTIEMRTEYTPPVTVSSRGLMTGPPNPLWAQLKPTLVLRGKLGERVIAPYGEASSDGSGGLAVVGGGLLTVFGAGFLLAMLFGGKR